MLNYEYECVSVWAYVHVSVVAHGDQNRTLEHLEQELPSYWNHSCSGLCSWESDWGHLSSLQVSLNNAFSSYLYSILTSFF